MTNNIAKIRAALESALARATSGSRVAELRDALAALAELERAAGEPVATVCLITDRFAHNHCIEAQLQVDQTTQLSIGTKLYTTPPPAKPAMGMFTADEMEAAYRRGRTDRKFPLDANDAWLTSATRQLVMERTS